MLLTAAVLYALSGPVSLWLRRRARAERGRAWTQRLWDALQREVLEALGHDAVLVPAAIAGRSTQRCRRRRATAAHAPARGDSAQRAAAARAGASPPRRPRRSRVPGARCRPLADAARRPAAKRALWPRLRALRRRRARVSAQAVDAAAAPASLRPMREADLDAVLAIELRAYAFPWTRGIFRDCLRADYPALGAASRAAGSSATACSASPPTRRTCSTSASAPEVQGHGHGRRLLRSLLQIARGRGAQRVFLEVRPSNPRAIALYHDEGFNEIGRRPRYYPARDGREDALVMAIELFADE